MAPQEWRQFLPETEVEPNWTVIEEVTKRTVDRGALDIDEADRRAYADDLQDVRRSLQGATVFGQQLPTTLDVFDRHHWIEVAAEALENRGSAAEDSHSLSSHLLSSVVNPGPRNTLAMPACAVLSSNDVPLGILTLEAETEPFVVHPNMLRIAREMNADVARIRRWVIAREVVVDSTLATGSWLVDGLTEPLDRVIRAENYDSFVSETPREELERFVSTLCIVEGYANRVLGELFQGSYDDIHFLVSSRISRLFSDPIVGSLTDDDRASAQRVGRRFVDTIVDQRGQAAIDAVLGDPENRPEKPELDAPQRWLDRVDP